jgi:hypothetical protein
MLATGEGNWARKGKADLGLADQVAAQAVDLGVAQAAVQAQGPTTTPTTLTAPTPMAPTTEMATETGTATASSPAMP